MEIRRAVQSDVLAIAKIHVDSWKTTYASIVPDAYLNQLNAESRAKLWKENIAKGVVFVAETESGNIVGFIDGGKERSGEYHEFDGELYSIYIAEAYQGLGIGEQLIKTLVDHLLELKLKSMLVWVLADNTACEFYQKMGAEIVDSKTIEIAGKQLIELAYGWDDITSINL